MDICGQDREKKAPAEIARFESDHDRHTGYAGNVVGDQLYVIVWFPGSNCNNDKRPTSNVQRSLFRQPRLKNNPCYYSPIR